MFTTAKIATLSAVLSAALVCGFSAQSARSTIEPTGTGKAFYDRVPQDATGGAPIAVAYASTGAAAKATAVRTETKGDLIRLAGSPGCADQAWPYISRDCLAAAEGTPTRSAVRTVTFEQRSGANTSTLVKGSALNVAAR